MDLQQTGEYAYLTLKNTCQKSDTERDNGTE